MPEPTTGPAATSGLYAFCVTRDTTSCPSMAGLDAGTTVRRVEFAGLAAIVCDIDVSAWTGSTGEANLQDLQWLGPRALRHEQVIEQVMAQGSVLPLRFGCLFSGEASVHRWLERNRDAIAGHLDAIADRSEWSVKGWLRGPQAAAALAKSAPPDPDQPTSPGARYLYEQKRKKAMARLARDWGRESGQAVLAALEPLYEGRRALGALPGSASARDEEVVFHYALLVAPGRAAALQQEVVRLNAMLGPRGLEVALSGPWPPYSFCPQLVDPSESGESGDAAKPGLA